MDSGNSGSLQSSSGGDDDYDSRAANQTTTATNFGLSNNPLPSSANTIPTSSSAAHLFGHVTTPFSHVPNPNPLYNLDLVWPDSAHTNNNLGNHNHPFLGPTPGPFLGPSSTNQTTTIAATTDKPSNTTTPPRPEQPVGSSTVKNSRKRTRASRRAPTTVLTTDTSNFRQMVQEFTGIPSPPFSAVATSSSPYSRRLDLFSGPGPLYPFRPSAQKLANTTNIANVTSAMPPLTNNSFSYQLQQSGSDQGYNSQILSQQPLLFGASKSSGFGEMGITQEHINANLSAFLSEGKGITNIDGRENISTTNDNNSGENNLVTSTRNEDGGGIHSWSYNQDL